MVGRGGFEFGGAAVATQSGGGSALFVLVVRGRRKEGRVGRMEGPGPYGAGMWRSSGLPSQQQWPAAKLAHGRRPAAGAG